MRGRIRSIKPEAHSDEDLWDLEQSTGLPIFRAYTGLWNYADREGRLEWRPRALKAAILPYWEGDFGAVLCALSDAGFLVRYEVDGRTYGAIPSFTKHQVVNNREDPSHLPPPPGETRPPRVPDASSTRAAHVPHAGKAEGKGTEGNGVEGNDASARQPVTAVGLAPDEPEPDEPTHKLVAREFEVRFLAARGAPPSWSHKNRDHCLTIAKWLDSLAGDTPVLLGRLLEGFFREPWAVEKGFPLGALAGDPSKYLKPPTRPPGGSSPPQLVPPEKRRGLDAKEGV